MITVMNTDSGGVTEYSLTGTSVAAIGENVYFSTTSQVLEEGATVVAGVVKTGWFSLGDPLSYTRLDRVKFVLGTRDAIEVYLHVRGYTGETTHGPFDVPAVNDAVPSSRVLRVPRWVKGQYWQVEIRNVTGGGLDLNEVVLEAEQGAQVRGG